MHARQRQIFSFLIRSECSFFHLNSCQEKNTKKRRVNKILSRCVAQRKAHTQCNVYSQAQQCKPLFGFGFVFLSEFKTHFEILCRCVCCCSFLGQSEIALSHFPSIPFFSESNSINLSTFSSFISLSLANDFVAKLWH